MAVASEADDLRYADVAVDAPVGHARAFTYSIPDRFTVRPGQLVWVPFGSQTLQGIVLELSSARPEFATRDILQPVEPAPLLGPEQLQLGRWMSRHYRSPLFAALSLMLPPGFESRVRSRVMPAPSSSDVGAHGCAPLREETAAALSALKDRGRMTQAEFVKLLGRRGNRELERLVERGQALREVSIPRPGVAPKYEAYLIPSQPDGVIPEGLSPRQTALLEAVRQPPGHLPLGEANREFGARNVNALWGKGLVAQDWWRTSGGPPPVPPSEPQQLTLTAEQSYALTQITAALDLSFHPPFNSPLRRGGECLVLPLMERGEYGTGRRHCLPAHSCCTASPGAARPKCT